MAESNCRVVFILVGCVGDLAVGSIHFGDDCGAVFRGFHTTCGIGGTHDAETQDDGANDAYPEWRDADKSCGKAGRAKEDDGSDDVEDDSHFFDWLFRRAF